MEKRPHTVAILTVAAGARLLTLWFVVVKFPHRWLYSRGIELGTLAQSIVAGKGLSSPFGGSTGPTALLAPGYPAVVALLFRIFGSFSFAAALALMVLQVLLTLATVMLIMHIARMNFGTRTANLAGTFWALSLPLIWMPTIFWDTCLCTLLLVGMVALALRSVRTPSLFVWIVMGAYTGLAALVNPVLLLPLLATMGWAAWQTWNISRYYFVASQLVLLLVFAPWPIRNAFELHAFIPLRSTVGFELWVGNRAQGNGYLDESVFPIFNPRELNDYVSKGEIAYMGNKSTLAREYIRSHPTEFLRLSMVRVIRFWTGSGSKDGSAIFVIHAVMTTSLGLAGVWFLFRRRRFSLAILFILPLILFPLPYYITHAEFRYRLVIDPLLTILAGYAVGEWISPLKFQHKVRIASAPSIR